MSRSVTIDPAEVVAAFAKDREEQAAERAKLPEQNPFIKHRFMLKSAGYPIARNLQDLALHLWNESASECHLGTLAADADAKHWKIATDLIAWYRVHGENDRDFMNLCREIYNQRANVGGE